MLVSTESPCLSEPGRDLVEYQQCTPTIAGAADLLPEPWRWQIGHGTDRLGDYGRDVALALEDVLNHPGTRHVAAIQVRCATWGRETIGTPVAGKGRNVLATWEQGTDAA